MKHIITALVLLFIFSCNAKQEAGDSKGIQDSENDGAEWVWLFDGTSTDQWRSAHHEVFPEQGWLVQSGELLNDGSGSGNLVSKEEFSDFILEWEWRLFDEGGNSGLKYFVKESVNGDSKSALGLEYQMLDDERHIWMQEGRMKPNDFHTTAALYEFFEPSDAKQMMPLGEFNKSRIVSRGIHVEHWLNGEKVLEYERGGEAFLKMKSDSKFKDLPEFGLHEKGHLLLQDHQSKVGFRNIKIKVLNG